MTKSFERKITYSKNAQDNSEPKEDISINILESFGINSTEFKENIAKIPSDLLELFERQFQSSPKALRVGTIENKDETKRAKKHAEEEYIEDPMDSLDEEAY